MKFFRLFLLLSIIFSVENVFSKAEDLKIPFIEEEVYSDIEDEITLSEEEMEEDVFDLEMEDPFDEDSEPVCEIAAREVALAYNRCANDQPNEESIKNNCSGEGLSLKRIDLSGQNLSKMNFTYADFTGSNLSNVDFSESILKMAKINDTISNDINFQKANLHMVMMHNGKFQNANFTEATLTSGNLLSLDLSGAKFNKADTRKACFEGSDLKEADFSGANICKVDFSSSRNLDTVKIDSNTKFDRDTKGPFLFIMELRQFATSVLLDEEDWNI